MKWGTKIKKKPMKNCWPLIKMVFYRLCFDFYVGLINLEGPNDCLITLIPKVHSPKTPNDYDIDQYLC